MSGFALQGATGVLSVGTTSSSAPIPLPGTATMWPHDVEVTNTGTEPVFVAFGGPSVAAVMPAPGAPTKGAIIPPGTTRTFNLCALGGVNHIAGITASGTSNVYFVAGQS